MKIFKNRLTEQEIKDSIDDNGIIKFVFSETFSEELEELMDDYEGFIGYIEETKLRNQGFDINSDVNFTVVGQEGNEVLIEVTGTLI